MVITNPRRMQEEPSLAAEDGWWESVLSDESRYGPAQPRASHPQYQDVPAPVARNAAIDSEHPKRNNDWGFAQDLFAQDQIISLSVVGYNRGGLLVENERLQGFVPYSHLVDMTCELEGDREGFLSKYEGQELRLKMIECVPEEGRAVFSERAARVDSGKRTQLFSSIQVGEIITGEVTNVTDFGVFVDLGGVEGLIHISELSWGRVIHPSHLASLGQQVRVQVLDIMPERCRIALSLKRLQPNPWEDARQRYAVDDIVPATITTVVSFGVFCRLEEGLEGLAHVSEIDLPSGQSVRETFSENQSVQVRIIHIDCQHQRLGLSLKLKVA